MKRIGFIKGNRVDFKDGFIVLPPMPTTVNLGEPDVYAESEAKLYPIGTLAWYPGMGKKYRYSKAGTALVGTKLLAHNGNRPSDYPTDHSYKNVHGFYGHLSQAYDEGAKELNFADTINKAKDFYEDSYLIHWPLADTGCYEESFVVSGPPAAIADPWSCTVKLYKPKKYAYVTDDNIQIWLNPYSNIVKPDVEAGPAARRFQTAMGVPTIPVQDGHYFWLQTAGPVFITPNGWADLCPGYAASKRVAWAHEHGALITCTDAAGAGDQPVGVLLSLTLENNADAWVNLDLDLGH